MDKFLNLLLTTPNQLFLFFKHNLFKSQLLFLFTDFKSLNNQFPSIFKSPLFFITSIIFILATPSASHKFPFFIILLKILLPITHIFLIMLNPKQAFVFQFIYTISLFSYLNYSFKIEPIFYEFLNQSFYPTVFGGYFLIILSYSYHWQLYKINQLKHKLSTLNEHYDHLSKNLPGVIYQLKLDQHNTFSVPYVNAKIKTCFNISQEDVLENAQCWMTLIHPDCLEELMLAIRKSANHMSLFDFKTHFLINGRSKWFHFKSNPIKFENCILWHGLCLDITKQIDIKAEKDLLQEKTTEQMLHLNKALKECKIGTWERAWDDTKHWWSDEMYELLNVEKHIKPTIKLYQSLLSEQCIIQYKKRLIQLENHTDSIECEVFLKHQPKVVLLSRIKIIRNKNGKPKHCYGTLTDISETYQAQKNLESAKEKQSLAEKKETITQQFLANISHELRTPLHCIFGFTKLLIRSKPLTENQKNYLNLVASNSSTLQLLIDQLLELNKMSQNSVPINLSKLYIKPFITHYEGSIQSLLKQKSIRFFVYFDEHCSYIYVDALKLEQILNNLMSNAIEYCALEGIIILNIESQGDLLHITVSDTGSGVSQDIKPIMFEQFNSFKHPFKRSKKGNGLGLAISKNLVQLHQGDIWLNDTQSVTSITFSLPKYKNKPKQLNHYQKKGEKIEST